MDQAAESCMNRADPWVRTRAVGRNRFWTPGLIQGLPQGSLPVPHAGVEVGWIASASCLLGRLRRTDLHLIILLWAIPDGCRRRGGRHPPLHRSHGSSEPGPLTETFEFR